MDTNLKKLSVERCRYLGGAWNWIQSQKELGVEMVQILRRCLKLDAKSEGAWCRKVQILRRCLELDAKSEGAR